MKYTSTYQSVLGPIRLASDGENLTGLWFEGCAYEKSGIDKDSLDKDLEVFALTKKWLDIYFRGQNPDFMPPISYKGTAFREEVWELLTQIPYGQTLTYGDLGKAIAQNRHIKSMSARAVGSAVGHNPISIIIPCHRVISANKALGGYGGGLERKIKLLDLEGIDTSKLRLTKQKPQS